MGTKAVSKVMKVTRQGPHLEGEGLCPWKYDQPMIPTGCICLAEYLGEQLVTEVRQTQL